VLKQRAGQAWVNAMEENRRNIDRLVGGRGGRFLDLGCNDGVETVRFAEAAKADSIVGVEIVDERAELARGRGVEVVAADLNAALPFPDASFDVIVSNQVIEHLNDTDLFVSELRRLLRPGGVAVTSTENLASWHNVLALTLGWQPFSLTNTSGVVLGLGNPVAVLRGQAADEWGTWQHRRVFAYRGLRELMEAHGLTVSEIAGAGYYPLPARFGRREPRHAAFLAVACTV
jgi:SAM-dependent methyltransferase